MKTKMRLITALKIWVVIYPSITLFFYLFGKPLALLPLYERTFILTIALVPWIIFVGVPFIDFILGKISSKKNNAKLG